jgi:hypothetical protein
MLTVIFIKIVLKCAETENWDKIPDDFINQLQRIQLNQQNRN